MSDERQRRRGERAERGERAQRGPKPGLSVDRIVRAAIAIADAEGLGAVSMRRVAEALGFTTMALYRYVPAKDELVNLMLDTVSGQPPPPDPAAAGDWRARLEQIARADHAMYQRHPWLLDVPVMGPPQGPNSLAWFEALMDAVSGLGLTTAEMLHVAMSISSYTRGVSGIGLQLDVAARRQGMNLEEFSEAYVGMLRDAVDDQRYPTLSAMLRSEMFDAADEAGEDIDDGFEFGLQRLLDGIEVLVSARSGVSGGVEGGAAGGEVRDESYGTPMHHRDESGVRYETARPGVTEATGRGGGEEAGRACAVCGAPLPQPHTGRPRTYCSRACRQRAYRSRRTAGEGGRERAGGTGS